MDILKALLVLLVLSHKSRSFPHDASNEVKGAKCPPPECAVDCTKKKVWMEPISGCPMCFCRDGKKPNSNGANITDQSSAEQLLGDTDEEITISQSDNEFIKALLGSTTNEMVPSTPKPGGVTAAVDEVLPEESPERPDNSPFQQRYSPRFNGYWDAQYPPASQRGNGNYWDTQYPPVYSRGYVQQYPPSVDDYWSPQYPMGHGNYYEFGDYSGMQYPPGNYHDSYYPVIDRALELNSEGQLIDKTRNQSLEFSNSQQRLPLKLGPYLTKKITIL